MLLKEILFFLNVLIVLAPSNYSLHLLPLMFSHIISFSFWQPHNSSTAARLPHVTTFVVYGSFYLILDFGMTNMRVVYKEWEALFLCVSLVWILIPWWFQVWQFLIVPGHCLHGGRQLQSILLQSCMEQHGEWVSSPLAIWGDPWYVAHMWHMKCWWPSSVRSTN